MKIKSVWCLIDSPDSDAGEKRTLVPLDDFIKCYDKRLHEMLDEKMKKEGWVKPADIFKNSTKGNAVE